MSTSLLCGYVTFEINKKMQENWVLKLIYVHFYIISLIIYCDGLNNQDVTCEKINSCKCAFHSGMGIDLSGFSKPWSNEYQSDPVLNGSIYIQPCSGTFIGPSPNDCSNGAAVCLYSNSQFKLIAKPEEASFLSPSPDEIYLTYLHNNISTSIRLLCNVASTALVDAGSTSANIKLTLQSPQACVTKVSASTPTDDKIDHSLSTGSVLVIILAVFTILYFGGGALVLKLTRGAEGKELIPNYDFWADLPYLVRDGAMFVFNGCKPAASYDRI